MNSLEASLTMALPKGRLTDQVQKFFEKLGLGFQFENRRLIAQDGGGLLKIFLVKNSDLPTYVNHGIAGLGVCGDDILYEAGYPFYRLTTLPFGGTGIYIAGKKGDRLALSEYPLTVATKFPEFTRDHFHKRRIPVEVIKLNGSVELAPVLGLSRYIVDLVETGNTLRANNLAVLEKLADIKVHLIANPAYYKIHYQRINKLVDILS